MKLQHKSRPTYSHPFSLIYSNLSMDRFLCIQEPSNITGYPSLAIIFFLLENGFAAYFLTCKITQQNSSHLLDALTTRWVESGSVVTSVNSYCRQHGDYTEIGSSCSNKKISSTTETIASIASWFILVKYSTSVWLVVIIGYIYFYTYLLPNTFYNLNFVYLK